MSKTTNVLLNWYSSMKKKWERFGWFLTKKIDVECQILALFDSSPLIQNSKYTNLLWVCWFLCKNLSNFVSSAGKLNNLYYHNGNTLGSKMYGIVGLFMKLNAYFPKGVTEGGSVATSTSFLNISFIWHEDLVM